MTPNTLPVPYHLLFSLLEIKTLGQKLMVVLMYMAGVLQNLYL